MSEQQTTAPQAPKPRTKVHSPAQLQAALGLNSSAWRRARWAGLVPPPDRAAGTYSGELVDELAARVEQIRAQLPDVLAESDLIAALVPEYGQWPRALAAGLVPPADQGEFWSREAVADLLADPAAWRSRIPAQPLGASRCALLLAELTGLDVHADDIPALAEAGLTAAVDEYKGFDLFDVDRLKALPEDAEALAVLRGLVEQRAAWIEASMTAQDAARYLHWDVKDLKAVAVERQIATGRDGRYARADIALLADDIELCERIRRAQLLGPEQAAQHMEIRRTDFEYVLAAGWVTAADTTLVKVGTRKTVAVDLYTVGSLEDALTIPGVDWEAVRAVHAGEPSPLREHARLAASRADVIHAFCRELREQFAIEVWPHWHNASDTWEIDWEQDENGLPGKDEVRALLYAHPGANQYVHDIRLSTEVGEVIRWARRMLEPSAAVIVDTETTGLFGSVAVELAVIDAASGKTLLNTLVNPAGVAVEPGAHAVHGISDEELADAPTWAEVWPRFRRAVRGRTLLAYNSGFDQGVIERTHQRAGLEIGELPGPWECLMRARSIRERVGYRIPLGGSHRALDDALDARTVLQAVAAAANPQRIGR